jgi:hypothetical protein
MATLCFAGIAVVIGPMMFAMREVAFKLPWPNSGDTFRDMNNKAIIYLCAGIAPVSFLTGMAYRTMRWKRVATPRDGESGNAPVASDLEHKTK